MNNHFSLLMGYLDELKDLAMVESWIDHARVVAATNEHVQAVLDLREAHIRARKNEIYDAMFEISRNN